MAQLDLLLSTVDCCMHTIYSHTPHSITVNFSAPCMYAPTTLVVVYILQSPLPDNFVPSSPPLLWMCRGSVLLITTIAVDSHI